MMPNSCDTSPLKVVTYKRLTRVKSLTQCPVPSLLTACFSLPPTFAAPPVAVLVLMPSLAQFVVRTLLVWFAAGSQLLEPWIHLLAKLHDNQNSEKFYKYTYRYYNTKEGKICSTVIKGHVTHNILYNLLVLIVGWLKSVTAISTSPTTISISSRQFQLHSQQFPFHLSNFNFVQGNFNFTVGYYPDRNGPLEPRQLFPVVLRQVKKNCHNRIEIAVVKLKLL